MFKTSLLQDTLYYILNKEGQDYFIIKGGAKLSSWSHIYNLLLEWSLIVSTFIAIVETTSWYANSEQFIIWVFTFLEIICVLAFTIDYLARVYSEPSGWRKYLPLGYTSPNSIRVCYATAPLSLIDLISVLPWWIYFFTGSVIANRYDGELRLLRISRLLAFGEVRKSKEIIFKVFKQQHKLLGMTAYVILSLWLILSALFNIFASQDTRILEDESIPASERYRSVLSSMPYTMMNLTGELPTFNCILPVKVLIDIFIVLGICVTSVPAAILGGSFINEFMPFRTFDRKQEKKAALIVKKKLKTFILAKMRKNDINSTNTQTIKEAKKKFMKQNNPSFQHLVYAILNGKCVKDFTVALIVINVVLVVLQSVSSITAFLGETFFNTIEFISVLFFTIEYIGRVYTATINPLFNFNRFSYIKSFLGILDLISFLPFWIEIFIWFFDHRGLKFSVFRVLRIFRILLLERFFVPWRLLDKVWNNCEYGVKTTGVVAFIIWIVASALFYEFEKSNPRMPEGAFKSIPSSMYYTAAFMGGGWEIVDFTGPGQVLCVIIGWLSIVLVATPSALAYEAFVDIVGGDA